MFRPLITDLSPFGNIPTGKKEPIAVGPCRVEKALDMATGRVGEGGRGNETTLGEIRWLVLRRSLNWFL